MRAVCSLAAAFGLSSEASSLLLWRPECGRNTLFVADKALQQLVEPSSEAGFKFVAVGAGGIKYKPPQHPGISSPRTERQLFSQSLRLSVSHLLFSLTHTLIITCTCCYDEINEIQNLQICSHADSLILSLVLDHASLHTHNHTLTYTHYHLYLLL